MVESALVFLVFMVLIAGLVQLGVVGLAMNSMTFAARRAARFASLRGSSSGHPASLADVQASARSYAAPFASQDVNVAVTWLPDNHTGSSVRVVVSYRMNSIVLPAPINLQSTALQVISQ